MSRIRLILPESCVLSLARQSGGARLALVVPGQAPRMPSGEEPLSSGSAGWEELDVHVRILVEGEEPDATELDQ